jgi:predicted GH43/DUF377 family glycosyl hydrolase
VIGIYGAIVIYFSVINTGGPKQTSTTVDDNSSMHWMLGGVVLDLGNQGDYDDKSIESPIVIKMGPGSFVMWYRGQTFSDQIGRIMRATSSDGLKWTKTGVVLLPTETYEGNKPDPMSVIYENGIFKMWYGGEGYGGCACYATSPDGINWTKYTGNPVLRKTSGSWDNEGAGGQHTVIKIGDKYYMYYKGFGSAAPGWTFYGLAESTDGVHWDKQGKILSPEPQIGETTTYRNLRAVKIDNYYCIVYSMVENLQISLASSKDGKAFVKNGFIFIHGRVPGGYDVKWSTSPCILIDGEIVRMWYEGGDANGRVRTLYAEIHKNNFIRAINNIVIPP